MREGTETRVDTSKRHAAGLDGLDGDRSPSRSRSDPSAGNIQSPVGLRTRRRQLEEESRRKAFAAIVGVALALALMGAGLYWAFGGGIGGRQSDDASRIGSASTLLLAYAPGGTDQPASAVVLFGLVGDGAGSALLIPAGTTTDIPVHGPGSLGDAVAFGGASLLDLSTENLLGVRVDHVVVIDRQGLEASLRGLEPFEVLIDDRVAVKEGDNIVTKFQPGRLVLDAASMAEFLELKGEGESEVARVARQQRGWQAILARAASSRGALLDLGGAEGHLSTTSTSDRLVQFLEELPRRDVSFTLLPVDPKQSLEGSESFEPRTVEIQRVILQHFPGAAIAPDVESRIKIGILNGNGGVGVTEEAAKRLVPGGYRVVYTENADHFSYQETLVVYYRLPDEKIARDVQSKLGRGKLVFNREMQDVVDVLVVLGADFPGPRSGGGG